jgi:hypothetical protein
MRKTVFIADFEKEAKEGKNQEHFDAVMDKWKKHWDQCIKDLTLEFDVKNALETMKLMDDFKKRTGKTEDRQYVLDHLNKRIRD